MASRLRPATLDFFQNLTGQHFAQLDTKLIERIQSPDNTLNEDAVLVEGNQCAQGRGRQGLGKNRVAGSIAGESPMGRLSVFPLPSGFFSSTEGQSLRLGKAMRHQNILMTQIRTMRLRKSQKITGNRVRTLMKKLKKSVLNVRARIAENERAT